MRQLVKEIGHDAVIASFNPDERDILKEFLEHGAEVRAGAHARGKGE